MRRTVLYRLGVVVTVVLGLVSCSDEYYSDGGILDPNIGKLEESTMSYLRSAGADFDTLVTLIDLTGMSSEIDNKCTFFATPDYSIKKYLELRLVELETQPESLDQIPDDIMDEIEEIIRNYIISDETIMRDDLTTTYTMFTTNGGREARLNLTIDDYLSNPNMGAEYIKYSVNMKREPVGEDIDDTEVSDRFMTVDILTSNLESTNGVIHILVPDSHMFGFDINEDNN